MPTAVHVTSEQLKEYQQTARRRREEEDQALKARYERAWALARSAATLLREEFGATRVALFGSLLDPQRFTRWSDVDIAVWGLEPADTLRAIGAVQDLDRDIPINVVDVQTCRPPVLREIERHGVAL